MTLLLRKQQTKPEFGETLEGENIYSNYIKLKVFIWSLKLKTHQPPNHQRLCMPLRHIFRISNYSLISKR